jgi:CheY-like chemotaxis protein
MLPAGSSGSRSRWKTAEGGQEAIEKIRTTTYDLILLDIMMPEVSGYDVLKESQDLLARAPIIMATAMIRARTS